MITCPISCHGHRSRTWLFLFRWYERLGPRYAKSILASVVSVLAKSTSLIALAVTMPLTISYLRAERFGLLSTITAGAAVLSFTDLGIGNGLLNLISTAYGRNDINMARRAVSSASLVLSVLAVIVFLAGYSAILFVPWPQLLHLHSSVAVAECRPALLTLLALFCVGMPAAVAQRVQMGYQEGFVANAWQAAAGLVSLVGIPVAVYMRVGLPWFIAATIGSQTLANVFSWVSEFTIRRPQLLPRLRTVDRGACMMILRSGLLILSAQAGASALYAAPAILLASTVGAVAVAPFAVLQRVMTVPLAITNALAGPLWPAYAEAAAVADFLWIKKTVYRSLILVASVMVVSAIALVTMRQSLLRVLSHGQLHSDLGMTVATGVWAVAVSLRSVLGVAALGCSLFKNAAVVVPVLAAAAFFPCLPFVGRHVPIEFGPLFTAACEFAVAFVLMRDIYFLLHTGREISN
jgi:O-antigen/teichoic acid export membrane protein